MSARSAESDRADHAAGAERTERTERAERTDAAAVPVRAFLRCASPAAWADAAVADLGTLLCDHAALELKAAQHAQALIRRYGLGVTAGVPAGQRHELMQRMSRLAREEMRHFEQVLALIDARGIELAPLPAARYAAALHALVRNDEPGRLVDTLVVGAVIEARSCERFAVLAPRLDGVDAELARFYRALLHSEARHFESYLALAEAVAGTDVGARVERVLRRDAELVCRPDTHLRFLSGPPATVPAAAGSATHLESALHFIMMD